MSNDNVRMPPSVHDFFKGYFDQYITDFHQTYTRINRKVSSSMSLILYNSPTFDEFVEYAKYQNSNPNRMIWGFIETVVKYNNSKNGSIQDFIDRQGEPVFFDTIKKWEDYMTTLTNEEQLRKVEDKLEEINNQVRKRRHLL